MVLILLLIGIKDGNEKSGDTMRTSFNNRKGLTLIEALFSIVLLSLVGVTFASLFSSSFVNIFIVGNKDHTVSIASDLLEMLYRVKPPLEDEEKIIETVKTFLDDNNLHYDVNDIINIEEMYKEIIISSDNGNNITNNIKGFRVEITIPYQTVAGERDIVLTSFVRGGD